MFIARQLQDNNRAEFLLYMWQVEDIIRSYECDIDKLRHGYLSQFQLTTEQHKEQDEWYEHLCSMLREEGKMEKGHLQINKNIIEGLGYVHSKLLSSDKFPYYREMYYKVLPYIVELRAKNGNSSTVGIVEELEICFEFLYGVMLLRHQKKEIFSQTQIAAKEISALLGQLSEYWKADKKGELSTE